MTPPMVCHMIGNVTPPGPYVMMAAACKLSILTIQNDGAQSPGCMEQPCRLCARVQERVKTQYFSGYTCILPGSSATHMDSFLFEHRDNHKYFEAICMQHHHTSNYPSPAVLSRTVHQMPLVCSLQCCLLLSSKK